MRWPRARLGDCLSVRYGKALPATDRYQGGVFPVVGSAGRMTGTDAALVRQPAVVIGRKGNVGQIQLEMAGCWPIDTTYFARVPDVFDARFLAHQLRSIGLDQLNSSTTTPSLRREDLESQRLCVPPMEEQQRLTDLLEGHVSRLDAAATTLAKARRRLSSLLDMLLEQASSGCWPTRTIASLATVGSGATPLKSRGDYYDNGTVPWVTSGALTDLAVDAPTSYVTELALAETALKIWPVGTLLVAMYGEGRTRGRCSELRFAATTNQACAAISLGPETDQFRSWIKLFLRSRYERMRRMAAGGVQPNLSLGLIKAIEVPIPPPAVRMRFLDGVADADIAVGRLRQALDSASGRQASLRRALLGAAFSGRL